MDLMDDEIGTLTPQDVADALADLKRSPEVHAEDPVVMRAEVVSTVPWMQRAVADVVRRHWRALKAAKGEPSAVLCDELAAVAATYVMFPDAGELERQRLAQQSRVAAILDTPAPVPVPSQAQVRSAVRQHMAASTDRVPADGARADG